MATEPSGHSLDALAAELQAVAKRARAAAADASLTAELVTMGGEMEAATQPIAEATSVLHDSARIALKPNEVSELVRRRQWLRAQLDSVGEQFHDDPTMIRRGTLWRDTRRAIAHLQEELIRLRDEHYQELLAEYLDEDGEHLRSLPPHTPGLEEYVRAISAYETLCATPPTSPADVDLAVDAGERLRERRAQIESETVPAEFRAQWRQLRGTGLSLHEFTGEFQAWLAERGIADDVVLRLRS